MWALSSSEAIQAVIKEKYKQQRHGDDENQPLSVQPWGIDGDKRRYFLVQGLDDTSFRVYREGSRYTRNAYWYNQAGTIDEVKALAKKLEEVDGTQAGRRLAGKMTNAIPTFEATEEVSNGQEASLCKQQLTGLQKRRRRDYRREQRARFTRPEPGYSLYEGRTRGKRMRYTYDDDDENFDSDATSTRRSARHSARNTPFEAGPTITASGRQVRQPRTGEYGESLLSAPPISTDELAPGSSDPERRTHSARPARSGTEDSEEPVRGHGRSTRGAVNGRSNPLKRGYNDIDGMSDEDDAQPSGDEWDSDKNGDGDEEMPDVGDDGDDDMDEADEESEEEDFEPKSLVVKIKVSPENLVKTTGRSVKLPLGNGTVYRSTEGSSLKHEIMADNESVKPQLTTGGTHQTPSHPTSSPAGPSSYPTPTSTSFLPNEQKNLVSTALDAPQPLPVQTNGVHESGPRPNMIKVGDREQMAFAGVNGH